MAKDGRVLLVSIVVAAGMLQGCGAGAPTALPTWASKEQPYTPQAGSSNAYDDYALIARNVEETVPAELLSRVFFDDIRQKQVLDKIERHIGMLVSASRKKCEFRYSPAALFAPPPYQRGWRLLGRALRWRIEAACGDGNFDLAVEYAVAATKFGFDLTGGGAIDASLGFEIADEARRAIAPHLPKLGAAQLAILAEGMQKALSSKPSLKQAVEHEHTRMMLGVQYVQDAYANERWSDLMKTMREDVRDGVAYLRDLRSQDKKRPAYFESFAKEAEDETRWLTTVADLPATERALQPKPPLASTRPWKSFSKQLFETAEPLLRIQDSTLARTRLAILTCQILKQVKNDQAAPKDLLSFPKELTMDPYTGRAFGYRAGGTMFQVYSLGLDGIDNAGDTDENFSAPDLTLER